jgi:hypothetical protein
MQFPDPIVCLQHVMVTSHRCPAPSSWLSAIKCAPNSHSFFSSHNQQNPRADTTQLAGPCAHNSSSNRSSKTTEIKVRCLCCLTRWPHKASEHTAGLPPLYKYLVLQNKLRIWIVGSSRPTLKRRGMLAQDACQAVMWNFDASASQQGDPVHVFDSSKSEKGAMQYAMPVARGQGIVSQRSHPADGHSCLSCAVPFHGP